MNHALLANMPTWLGPPASTSAENHDFVFYLLLYVMAFFFVLVVTVMLAFVVLYRRRKGQRTDDAPTHNTPLEIFWTAIPLAIVIAFFVLGLRYYIDLEAAPAGADLVEVEASQWQFNFKYPNGAESSDLYLLIGRPVILKLTSKDVTHALYIPAFRAGRNAVPGQETELWFKPTVLTTGKNAEGEDAYLHVYCTQYCGNGHAEMHAKAFVLEEKEYKQKLADAANIFVDRTTKQPLPYAKVGEKLYKSYCSQCHSLDGASVQAPTWKGLYKRDHEFSESDEPGYTLKEADSDAKWDAYLRESILRPEAKVVKGFGKNMPPQASTFSGSKVKDKKLAAIVEFIKSQGNPKYYKPLPTPPLDADDAPPPGGEKKAEKPEAKAGAAPKKPPAEERPSDPPVDRTAPQAKEPVK